MTIDWKGIGQEIKRRREGLKLTQDFLASKIGVRLATIARLEIGDRRPSLPMLEKLAKALQCQIKDLLREEEELMGQTEVMREPSMKGAPSYFRFAVMDAAKGKVLGEDEEGDPIRATYDEAAWHLAIHVEDYLSDEALEELQNLEEESNEANFAKRLLKFFDQEFPGCMALIPTEHRKQFLEGVFRAMEDGRFPIARG